MSAGYIGLSHATWSAPIENAVPYGVDADPHMYPHLIAQQAGPEEPLNFTVVHGKATAMASGNQGDRQHLSLVNSYADDPGRAEIQALPGGAVVLPSAVRQVETHWGRLGIAADYFGMPAAADIGAVVLIENPEQPYTVDLDGYEQVVTERNIVIAGLRVLVSQALHPADWSAHPRRELVGAGFRA